ncbi:MAG: M23 family metallopeptidase [Treponema sp.]|jgi:murein DD-endopeptidase MepM/ murein hydrolase activator NlpD|nr:M23 family metallopeptidase [Treponema sp.]
MNIRIGILGLFLLTAASLTAVLAEETVHIVQKGETVYSIARSFGVDRDELMRINGISDPTKLRTGQRLAIPGKAGTPAAVPGASGGGEILHRTSRGETFYSIARRYGVSVEQVLETNSLDKDYVLKQGDVLRIPGASGAAAVAPALPATVVAAAAPAAEPRSTESRRVDASVRWPVAAKDVSYMTGKLSGVVITGERTEAVKSLTQGTVISAGPYRGFGRVAIIQVTGGYLYVYGGCESLSVKEGDKVGPGMELGRLGIDAVSGKPQLFFLVYRGNAPVDPAKAPRA